MLEINCRRGVPELVDRDAQTGCLLDPVRNLDAEQMRILGSPGLAREQSVIIGPAN